MNIQRPWLLATDMDGTVIPLEDTPRRRREVAAFREAVTGREDLLLAYVTGRHLALAEDGIQAFGLPRPDLLATDVGTAVYRWTGAEFRPDPEYADLMRDAMGGVTAGDLRAALLPDPALELQEEDRQGPHKVSFYVDPGVDEAVLLDRLRPILAEAGARVALVFSRDELRGVGLLDVLPRGVAKDSAVRFLHDRTGVEEERLVYAGDSGNDRAAILAGYRVVVVGNAPEGLKEELREAARERRSLDRLYFAKEPYAAGVLEGLRHWGVV